MKDLISLTDEEILQKWEEQRTEAAALGARMHNSIEAFLNCGSYPALCRRACQSHRIRPVIFLPTATDSVSDRVAGLRF